MFTPGVFRVETILNVLGESEKVGMGQPAPLITRQGFTQGDHSVPMPFDHRSEVFDDHERVHARILKGGRRGVAQTKPSYNHVQVIVFQGSETEFGQLTLGLMKQTGHQEFLAQLDFIDIEFPQLGNSSSAQRELPDGGDLKIKFFEDQKSESFLNEGE